MIANTNSSSNIYQGHRKDFRVKRGDTFEYEYTHTYVDSDGVEQDYDFTGCIGGMMLKKKKTDTIPAIMATVAFSTTTATFSIAAERMRLLDPGIYYYDLEIYDTNDENVTKLEGKFVVLQDITNFITPAEPDIITLFETIYGYEFQPSVHQLGTFNTEISYEFQPLLEINGIFSSEIETEVTPIIAYNYTQLFYSEIMAIDDVLKYNSLTLFNTEVDYVHDETSYLYTLLDSEISYTVIEYD